MFKVGKVLRFYKKTGMATVELDGMLAVNDRIFFVRQGENLFEQTVDSIQVGYTKIDSATKGSVVVLKTNEDVREEDEIFKI